MNRFQRIINRFKKEKYLEYPNDFAIVDYSRVALDNGIKDDQNKVITRYSYNKFGNLKVTKYKYSEQRVDSLIDVYNIPIFDKTKKHDPKFPIYANVLPGEIQFQSK